MSNPTESLQIPPEYSVPLLNLSAVRTRMDSLQRFLSESVSKNTIISEREMDLVSAGISAAIHQTIVNGAALLSSCSSSQIPAPPSDEKPREKPPPVGNYNNTPESNLKEEDKDDEVDADCKIVELDAVELLAEHVHFCEICGKGFKRDANLRMHMRAHGNQYKTPEALAKPQSNNSNGCSGTASLKRRFSCPYEGCNRNKKHKKFRPLKSVICVKNHVKRSHCPKIYACNRCNKKSFSVVADLKSHLKHCGESRWKCSCGTSFSRKDKLFGHMALFEGHMPAVEEEAAEKKGKSCDAVEEDNEDLIPDSGFDDGFFEGLILDGFGSIDSYSWQDMLNSPNINGWQ